MSFFLFFLIRTCTLTPENRDEVGMNSKQFDKELTLCCARGLLLMRSWTASQYDKAVQIDTAVHVVSDCPTIHTGIHMMYM